MRRILRCITLALPLFCGWADAAPSAPVARPPLPVSAIQGKPGTIAVAGNGITYFAQGGDTLSSIALAYTGRRANWAALGKLNRIEKDVSIPIGTGILIPADLLTDEPAEATVAALSGSSRAVTADGRTVTLAIGMRVGEGIEIHTGANSFLTFSLGDGSRISVPSNSRVRFAKLRLTRYTRSPRTELMLLRGRVESRVAPLEPVKGRFEVRTPQSVAGVRGTRFRVAMVEGGVAHEVLSGNVAVGTLRRPAAAQVAAAHGALAGKAGVGPVVDLLPAPQIAAPDAAASYPSARFVLTPLAGASAYHIQISTDPEGLNPIAENRSAQPQLAVDGLRDGDYYMHVSAFDRAGLQGLTRTEAFTLRQQAPLPPQARMAPPAAPYVERSDARSVTLRWNAQPGVRYQLQVARDIEFSWLVHSSATDLAEATVPRPPFGTYYARVLAIGAGPATTTASSVQPFVVTDHWVLNEGTPLRPKETAPGASGIPN